MKNQIKSGRKGNKTTSQKMKRDEKQTLTKKTIKDNEPKKGSDALIVSFYSLLSNVSSLVIY
jgi:hypothetical protein